MSLRLPLEGNDDDDDLNPFGEEEEDYDEGGEDTPIESE
jgi:hypothetical protein